MNEALWNVRIDWRNGKDPSKHKIFFDKEE